jgi:allantoinase
MAVRGNIVLGERVVRGGALLIDNGKISVVADTCADSQADTVIDARGKLILPGAVDSHVHSLSFPGEGFFHSTRSAAGGGVTTIVDMPVDAPAGIAGPEALARKITLVEKESFVDVALLGSVKNDTIGNIPLLKEGGVCGFKLSLFDTDPDRFPRVTDGRLLEAFSAISRTGLTAGVHAENDEIIKYLIDLYSMQGKTYPRAHCETRPPVSETESVLKALEFAWATGVRLHLYHVSLSRSVDLANYYRSQGVAVSAETCPHYLVFCDEDMDRLGGRLRINPPVRKKTERELLWQKIRVGDIGCVSSDHAPWPADRKESTSIFESASGCPGVETLLPLVYSEGVVTGRISLAVLVRVIAETPARLFGLYPKKGSLLPGSDADLVILNPRKKWTIRADELHSSAGWTPYEGMEVNGCVETTIVRGMIVYHKGEFPESKGTGRFVRPVDGRKRPRDDGRPSLRDYDDGRRKKFLHSSERSERST